MGTSNLSELTVTCSQCGSASMQPLGGREYRCNHCGAITVVSQDQGDRTVAAPNRSPDTPASFSAGKVAGRAVTSAGWKLMIIPALSILIIVLHGIFSSSHSSSRTDPSPTASQPVKTIPIDQVSLGPATWAPGSDGKQGSYVGLLSNHSAVPIQVPEYSMSLYIKSVRIGTARGTAPVSYVLPGESVPLAFSFTTPLSSPHIEVDTPHEVQEADPQPGKLTLRSPQLVRTAEQTGYRMVGVVQNGGTAVDDAVVVVMVFAAHNVLLGYGTTKTHALRSGEQTLVDVTIPSNNVNPVSSYQYLIESSVTGA